MQVNVYHSKAWTKSEVAITRHGLWVQFLLQALTVEATDKFLTSYSTATRYYYSLVSDLVEQKFCADGSSWFST